MTIPIKQTYPRPEKLILEGQYCTLIPLDVDTHGRSLYEAFSVDMKGENWTYLPYGPFHSEPEFIQWLNVYCLKDDPLFFSIHKRDNPKALGMLSLVSIVPENGCVEIGHVHFSLALQKTREATESIFLLMQYIFDNLGYRRLEWKCDNLNKGSKRSALRFGFTFEGIFRQHRIYKNRNRDTAWFSMLDNEWHNELRTSYEKWLSRSNFDEIGKQREPLNILTTTET